MHDEVENGHKFGVAAILGPPNAGKSTLMNGMLGEKVAIVTPKPQTTRNRISGILSAPDAQVVFMDTPGVHTYSGRMNEALIRQAWGAAESADAAMLVLDADLYRRKPGALDKETAPLLKRLGRASVPVLVVLNKIDLIGDKRELLPVMERVGELFPDKDIYPVSAATGRGLEDLLERVKTFLPQSPPMYPEDQISTVPLRFMVSEMVREKLFMALRDELPYSTAVEIENWEEVPEKNLLQVGALIYVTKPNHKGMVIGKGGKVLKEVGRQAREEIAELLDQKVYLELWVKVRERWTEDVGFLRQIGLEE
jgi:GTP-binding protein Era